VSCTPKRPTKVLLCVDMQVNGGASNPGDIKAVSVSKAIMFSPKEKGHT